MDEMDCSKNPSFSNPIDDCRIHEGRKLSIQAGIQSLTHACQCRDLSCLFPGCRRTKQVVRHTKVCKLKVKGNCPICKRLLDLCYYHAKYCKDTKCDVPICSPVKLKMKQNEVQKRLHQAQVPSGDMASGISSESRAPGTEASYLDASIQTITNELRHSLRISSVRRK